MRGVDDARFESGGQIVPKASLAGLLEAALDRHTCYFDGLCGMCRRSVRVLGWLDWLGRLQFEDMTRSPQLPVGMDLAMAGMPMRTASGRVLVGFPAVRRALVATPLGCLPGLVLFLPVVSWAGRATYDWVARNRRRACVLDPQPVAK